MSSEADIIRSAVLASLRNDRKIREVVGEARPTGTASEEAEQAEQVEGVQTTTRAGEETPNKSMIKNTKRRTRKSRQDSNWKQLQKTIQPDGKTKRHATNSNPAGRTAGEGDTGPDTGKPAQESFSAFMKRAVRPDARLTKIVALDCEMVGVGPDGKTDALARVSVVNQTGDVLYDTFVKPGEAVTDFRTQYSGVRPADLESAAAVTAYEAQGIVGALLHNRVVVGHSLKNDFRVLRVSHPWQLVRDTSVFYKRLWGRGRHKPALRMLVAKVLGVDAFQKGEHDSCEDARAALELYKRNAKEWESSIQQTGGWSRRRVDQRKDQAKQLLLKDQHMPLDGQN